MKYIGTKIENIKLTYIGGGSRGWARGLMSDLATEEHLCGTVTLFDIDCKAAKDNEIIGNSLKHIDNVKSIWKYKTAETLKDAIKGAEFIVISILPGTFNEMESDVHEPEKYGIYQSVGDTVGPGGIIRALRTIPMFVEIAEAIKQHAPNAWVINYTNPLTLCVRTLYEVFPNIKAFGCCHEVFGTQKLLTKVLADIEGIKDVKREEICINVLGINHFTWIDKATYKGLNIFSTYQQFVEKYYETGYIEGNDNNWMNSHFSSAQRVKMDLFKRYNIIAAAGDRHLAEFCPGNWYLKNPETIKQWIFSLTPVSWRKNDLKQKLDNTKKIINGEKNFKINKTGEEGVKQIKALLGLNNIITNVNIPNIGQIQGIPIGSVIETNALFTNNNVQPINTGKLPNPVNNLVLRHVYNQETIIKAVMNKNINLLFVAFVNDPLTIISLNEAKKLFNTMLINTKKYLPNWVRLI